MCSNEVVDLTGTCNGASASPKPPSRGAVGSFSKGAVRLTQSRADSFDPHKVSFADVLQADQLSKCLLTAYVMEEGWLRGQLADVPRAILVIDNGKHLSRVETYASTPQLTMVHPRFPAFPNYGVMHIKLMLLWYEAARVLRVVVSSGNLRSEDYDLLQNVAGHRVGMLPLTVAIS